MTWQLAFWLLAAVSFVINAADYWRHLKARAEFKITIAQLLEERDEYIETERRLLAENNALREKLNEALQGLRFETDPPEVGLDCEEEKPCT